MYSRDVDHHTQNTMHMHVRQSHTCHYKSTEHLLSSSIHSMFFTHSHSLTFSFTHIFTHTHSQYGQVAEEEHGSLHPRCLIRAHPRRLSREQTNPETNFVYITVYCTPKLPSLLIAFIHQKIAVKILTALAIILCMCIQQNFAVYTI